MRFVNKINNLPSNILSALSLGKADFFCSLDWFDNFIKTVAEVDGLDVKYIYMSDKFNNDPEYHRYSSINNKIKTLLKTDIKLREQFELKFDENMNWGNQGTYWEVDHIIPVLKLLRSGFVSDKEINNIDNIRPLKIKENRERNKKY
jgi:hypothetical protein